MIGDAAPITVSIHDEVTGERTDRTFEHWILALAAVQLVFARPGWDPFSRDAIIACRRDGRRLEITRRLPS